MNHSGDFREFRADVCLSREVLVARVILKFLPEDLRGSSSQEGNQLKRLLPLFRQQAARSLAQCLYDLGQNCTEQQMLMLWKMIEQLTQDSEPGVRLELLEHLSLLSGICLNRQDHMRAFGSANRAFPMPPKPLLVRLHRRCIIPSLTTLMLDQVLQVRKTSHLILFRMLECRLLAPPGICKEILPTVLQLAKVSADNADDNATQGDLHDQRQEAATVSFTQRHLWIS